MTLYYVLTGCPACGQEVSHIEETDGSINLMQDVPLSARYCPLCGFEVDKADGWDLREEAEVERVPPTQERSVHSDTEQEDDRR